VARLFLAVWLAAFAVQTTDVLAAVAAETCDEESGAAFDPCPEACAHCLCCARVTASMPQNPPVPLGADGQRGGTPAPLDPSTTASPHGVYHVPKHS
jgi:hypothetical protein